MYLHPVFSKAQLLLKVISFQALAKRRRLKEQLIVGSLYRWYNNAKKELKVNISDLLITSK